MAVKILKSEKSSKNNSELAILQSTRYATIVQYLGSFWTQSPNGYHLCLVMEVTGPSIRDYIESLWYGMLDSNTAIDLSRQCVTALKTLHDSGFAHGGQSLQANTNGTLDNMLISLCNNRCLFSERRTWSIRYF